MLRRWWVRFPIRRIPKFLPQLVQVTLFSLATMAAPQKHSKWYSTTVSNAISGVISYSNGSADQIAYAPAQGQRRNFPLGCAGRVSARTSPDFLNSRCSGCFYFPLLLGDEVVISLDKRLTDGDEDDRNENKQNNV